MGTLSSLLDISQKALQSNQAALDVVSKNVANQNVAGYTRETVNWSADVVTINGEGLGSGSDTGLTAVSQRDRVLEQRVQQQTQAQSQSSAKETALNQLQTVFGLNSSTTSALSTTLGSAIDGLFNSFSSLAAAPTDTATRQAVLSAAGALASAFQSASDSIASTSSGLTQTAVSVVSKVNGLTTEIATLNQQINSLSPNADAGELEDQRQQAIADLSQYVGLDQTTTTENNGLTLSTTNGTVLVSGAKSFALSASATGNGQTGIYAAGSTTDISSGVTGGQLGGILSVQKNDVAQAGSSLDQLAYAIGTAINTQNEAGLDGNGNAGAAIFTLPSSASGAAHSIAVATTDPSAIAGAGTGEGAGGTTNANALANLGTTAILSGQSAPTYLAGLLSTIGNAASAATSDQTAQQAALDQLTTQRNALSGVSLDEEAASLSNYQRSYQAASKLFSVVDTLLEAAINLGTVTTV